MQAFFTSANTYPVQFEGWVEGNVDRPPKAFVKFSHSKVHLHGVQNPYLALQDDNMFWMVRRRMKPDECLQVNLRLDCVLM